jgi:hypothetical protein
MPFTPRNDANFYSNYRLQIHGNEGGSATIYQPNDHVPTIGYGYTFIRTNRLQQDISSIGRTLTTQQLSDLQLVANALNNGQPASPTH